MTQGKTEVRRGRVFVVLVLLFLMDGCPSFSGARIKADSHLIRATVLKHWLQRGEMPASLDRILGLKGYLNYGDWEYETYKQTESLTNPIEYYIEVGNYELYGWLAFGGLSVLWAIAPIDFNDPKVIALLSPKDLRSVWTPGFDLVRMRLQREAFVAAGEISPELRQVGESLVTEILRTFVQDGKFPTSTPDVVAKAGWFYQAPTEKEDGILSPVENAISSDSFFLRLDFSDLYIDT